MNEKTMRSVLSIALAAVAVVTAVGAFSKTNKPAGVLRIGDINGTNEWMLNDSVIHILGTNEIWFTIRGMPPLNTNLENIVIVSSYEPVVTKTNLGQWEIRFRKVEK